MATITAVWTPQNVEIPNAASFNQLDAKLATMDGVQVEDQTLSITASATSFFNVAPGDYTVTVQLMDNQGNIGGVPLTGAITVPPNPTAPQPTNLVLTLS